MKLIDNRYNDSYLMEVSSDYYDAFVKEEDVPEKQLYIAILERALLDLQGASIQNTFQSMGTLQAQTIAWFYGLGQFEDSIVTFKYIEEVLDLPSNTVETILNRVKDTEDKLKVTRRRVQHP